MSAFSPGGCRSLASKLPFGSGFPERTRSAPDRPARGPDVASKSSTPSVSKGGGGEEGEEGGGGGGEVYVGFMVGLGWVYGRFLVGLWWVHGVNKKVPLG